MCGSLLECSGQTKTKTKRLPTEERLSTEERVGSVSKDGVTKPCARALQVPSQISKYLDAGVFEIT